MAGRADRMRDVRSSWKKDAFGEEIGSVEGPLLQANIPVKEVCRLVDIIAKSLINALWNTMW